MAYIDPYTGQEVLTPEEQEAKRKREQEIADTAVQTEERKIYGDGTQEITTTREIPPEIPAPVNPNQIQPQPTPQPKPQFDRNAYNASIAQQESGNRPDIGFHDRTKSSAYGVFGITAPAYQDARRRDPSLPEDITQATAEQQTRAQNIITDNNARFLQQRGVEATPGVLAAAHFVGANGLHKYLTQKDEQGRPYISPQAQTANGGYDKAAAIINGRLNGQAAPASGAVQQPQPQPAPVSPEPAVNQQYNLAPGAAYQGLQVPGMMQGQPQVQQTQNAIERYQAAQDDPLALIQLRSDTSQPAYIRQRAGNRVAEMITNENNRAAAEAALPALSQNELARVATKKSEGNSVGDWLQYLLFKHVGLNDLANQKGEQLGIGHSWTRSTITDESGNSIPVEIQTSASGKLLQGNLLDGTPLTKQQLNQTGGALGKGTSVSAEVYVDSKTGARYRSGVDSQGNAAMINVQGGAPFRGNPRDLEVQSISTSIAKAEGGKKVSLTYDPIIAAATAGAKELGEANAKYGTNFAIVGYGAPGAANAGKPILVDQTTNQIVSPDAQGKVTVTQGVAPTVMPQGGTAALATGEKLRGERSSAMNKVLDEEVRPQAQAGDTVSSVRKQQFAIFDRPGVDANKLFGLANASGEGANAQKYTMLRDLLSGYVARNADGTPMNGEQLSQRFAGLNLTPTEKSALAEYNISNQKINAATLKQTAGPGSVSNVEQQANRESNVDITKIPALGAFNAMAQSQFDGDRARYKADWAATQTFTSALDMDKAWRKENQRLATLYGDIAKERIKFVNENGNTYNAVREGYRRFPVPEYDPGTESWKKTRPLSSFNR